MKSRIITSDASRGVGGISGQPILHRIASLVAATGLGLSAIAFSGILNPQYENAYMIPTRIIEQHKTIKGKIVSVYDGDTYRLRHMNNIFSTGDFTGKLADHTISIRIAAVDTPEKGRNGDEGQPYSAEATDFAKRKLLGKIVTVKCLGRDQYGRLIGLVQYKEKDWFFNTDKDISEELLKSGYASVYRQRGAEYDGTVEKWNRLEMEAKNQRKGIWKSQKERIELPSDYKRRMRKIAP